ncbi:MAG: hypothetical protein PHW13_10385 [Methylococcales bacterium]|nr:hypothetical protein [Methylococcales bacterium]
MQMIKVGRYTRLALGCVLAWGVSNAKADITPQMWTGSSNPSDLGLMVWDQNAATSYAVDLNISLLSFMSQEATTNMTWDLDSVFTSFASTGDALTFNIAGANYGLTRADPNDSLLFSYPTGNTASSYLTSTYTESLVLKNQNVVQSEWSLQGTVGAETVNSSNSAYFADPINYWNVGQGGPTQNHSAVYGGGGADALSVAFYNSPGGTVKTSTPYITTEPAGYFSLSESGGNYYLNWSSTAAVSAVPVPGAVWLFLSGILTLQGFRKRKIAV